MADCDGFFDNLGISFHPDQQDAAVYAVWSSDELPFHEKKWMILCWFDVTYGEWDGNQFRLIDSRAKMSSYLARSPFRSFEELLAAPELQKPAN